MNQYSPPKSEVSTNNNPEMEAAAGRNSVTLFVAGLVAVCVLAGTVNFTVPAFRELFVGFGADLPLFTQIALNYYQYLWLLLLVVIAVRFAWPNKRSAPLAACIVGVGLLIVGMVVVMAAMYLPIFQLGEVV
jgi:type II secretory pathway component PulF